MIVGLNIAQSLANICGEPSLVRPKRFTVGAGHPKIWKDMPPDGHLRRLRRLQARP
jgi:hypothetical protein